MPEPLAEFLRGHYVQSVRQLGLKGVKNGKLLAAIGSGQFEAFITNDKRLQADGQLVRRPFAILILSVTNWTLMKPHVEKIAAALGRAEPGSIEQVECGRFVPSRKARTPSP